jgi:hypothetical protein
MMLVTRTAGRVITGLREHSLTGTWVKTAVQSNP